MVLIALITLIYFLGLCRLIFDHTDFDYVRILVGFKFCWLSALSLQLLAKNLLPFTFRLYPFTLNQALIFIILLLIRDSETGVMPKKLAM